MKQQLKDSGRRTTGWYGEKDSKKQLITSLGAVRFTKTLFRNRETGKIEFLLDRILGLENMKGSEKKLYKFLIGEAVRKVAWKEL